MLQGKCWVVAALILTVFWAGPAVALSQAELARELPRRFSGTFQWDGEDQVQRVELEFQRVREMKSGRLQASGPGIYNVGGRVTRITFQAVIDPADLGIELIEQDPNRDQFETDGSHRGRLSADLHEIRARWATRKTGKSGVLILRAMQEKSGR